MLFFLMSCIAGQEIFASAIKQKKNNTFSNDHSKSDLNSKELLNIILEKGGSRFTQSLCEMYEKFKEYRSLDEFISYCKKLVQLSDNEWGKINNAFSKLSEDSRKQWVGSSLLSNKKTLQEFIAQLPKYLRDEAASKKLEEDKKEAVSGIQKEYDNLIKPTVSHDFLFTGLGFARRCIDEYSLIKDPSGRKDLLEKDRPEKPLNNMLVQSVGEGITGISLYKELWYSFKNAPKLLEYATSNRRITPRNEEIQEAQAEYCMEHLFPQIVNKILIDGAQNGLDITQIMNRDKKVEDRESRIHMIKFDNATDRLVDSLFPFVPQTIRPVAHALTKGFLFEMLPSISRMVLTKQWEIEVENKKNNTTLDTSYGSICKSLGEDILKPGGFKEIMKNERNKTICFKFVGSICWSLVVPSINGLRSRLHEVSPYLPLFITSNSYQSWSAILTRVFFDKSTLLDNVHIPGLEASNKDNVIYWEMYKKTNGLKESAKSLDEYLQEKIPETITRMIVGGGAHIGIEKYRDQIVDTVDGFGNMLAKGTKMILPRSISSRLINLVSFCKKSGEKLSGVFLPLYATYKVSRKQSGYKGCIDIFNDFQNDQRINQYVDGKLSQMFAKKLFFTGWNYWKSQSIDAARTDSWTKIIGKTGLWLLYNSGTRKNKNKKGMEGLEALLG